MAVAVEALADPGAPYDIRIDGLVGLASMDTQRAAAFADQIDQLALPSRAAGSEILECTTEEEIPVKISRGEYTDDFLVEPDD